MAVQKSAFALFFGNRGVFPASLIAEAREAVYEGENIDLTEIQGLVQEVCETIQHDPPADGGLVHDKIVAMISSLNRLAEELKDQQKRTGAEVIRHAARKSYTRNQDDT